MKKLNTPEVVREISARMGCYKKDTRELLQYFSNLVVENIAAGNKVSISCLGTFYPAEAKRSKDKTLKIKFKPAKGVAEKVKKGGENKCEEELQ